MRRFLIVMVLAMVAPSAMATPEAATWRRQTLVGENAGCFFRYVTISENPASYYSYRRTLRLEKVSKSDLRVVEQIPLRVVAYTQDMHTGLWSERSVAPPPFDLSGYLTRNAVHLSFSDDLIRTFSIDSSGVWEVFEDGRVRLAGRSDLRWQIHDLGDDPHVVGIERTGYEPGAGGQAFVYLRICSNSAARDADRVPLAAYLPPAGLYSEPSRQPRIVGAAISVRRASISCSHVAISFRSGTGA